MKIALFGAGVIGQIHARNIGHSQDAELAHVVDVERAKADEQHPDERHQREAGGPTEEDLLVYSKRVAHGKPHPRKRALEVTA